MSETCFLCTCPEDNVQNNVQNNVTDVNISNKAGGMYNDAQMSHVRPEHDARLWGAPRSSVIAWMSA